MGRRSKQKSCFPCVEAKRQCDRSLPSCSRCLDREIECKYAPVRRPLRLPAPVEVSRPTLELNNSWDLNQSWPGTQYSVGDALFRQQLDTLDENLCIPTTLESIDAAISTIDSNNASSSACSTTQSGTCENDIRTRQLTPTTERLSWFLMSSSWDVAHQQQPPSFIPPAAVFTNFVRGLQSWLVRFLRKGHNPFIHRHLYLETTMPRCIQDAYAAIAVAQNVSSDNEHAVDAISSTYILDLLASHSGTDTSFSLLTTREHLARTQALLIHLLVSLFSSSIPRRAKAESLIDVLRLWARQLWESATLDATTSAIYPNTLSMMEDCGRDANEAIPSLYRAFILSESVRRTFLLTSIATGVYSSLQQTWSHACHGDVFVTLRAELWDAPSSARWEAVARRHDPLFIQSLQGHSLVERGVPAADVDEFARLLFTVMWGLEKVERWVVTTGDSVSVMY
ncbi:mnng and nitrosoguanidine resistance protein [Colletotrichum truncatum]|uniref:Mnng and nitrosoguanidine resistance protein n=1 Tax=Colletotrichum truncatum TaxID=5467 RepID=A0ACC3YPF1_COLTU|nr:mnng and nitrosoguanidine resistance protein [Colletotrichum truncatum]KAF6784262.1 mnng and nitrosoguanidine resistance protein [Colletotrichum truncatum]